jgi:hypothetical protein
MSQILSQTLIELLTSGCDERVFIHEDTATNKYHLHPLHYQYSLQRGSCTCNILTPEGHQVADKFLTAIPSANYQEVVASQTQRLKLLLTNHSMDEFEVVYTPSGSDAMYVPLMFQSVLHPKQTIINVVSCPEELGSGSVVAAQAKYYANWNQFGESTEAHSLVVGAPRVETFFLPARDKSGSILNKKQAIRDIVNANVGQPIVVNLVFGSKSGIKDDLAIIDEFPTGVIWVVDMCQFRVDKVLIHKLLSKGVMIMVTGSKFYQAPPFCGALLVPSSWVNALQSCDASSVSAFSQLFSRYDFPALLQGFSDVLPDYKNWGLRMRWQVALEEMEAYNAISEDISNLWIRRWRRVVTDRLAMNNMFTLMPGMELTTDSIISFSVVVNGYELTMLELKAVFEKIVTSRHEGLVGYEKIFIGQPVKYGDRAFIRLAVGSNCVRTQIVRGKFYPVNDLRVVEIIEQITLELYG